jgi:hypothetical protein
MAVEIRCADHVAPLYPQKLTLTSPTFGGRSVGIVRSQTNAAEFLFVSDCTVASIFTAVHMSYVETASAYDSAKFPQAKITLFRRAGLIQHNQSHAPDSKLMPSAELSWSDVFQKIKNQTPWPESVSELYQPSDRRLSAKLVPTFADRGSHVVSMTADVFHCTEHSRDIIKVEKNSKLMTTLCALLLIWQPFKRPSLYRMLIGTAEVWLHGKSINVTLKLQYSYLLLTTRCVGKIMTVHLQDKH